jgi:hypothetical protein
MLNQDYSKRDYFLPEGCKDLLDVINLQKSQVSWQIPWQTSQIPWPVGQPQTPTSPPKGDILLQHNITVGDFASILGHKPFKVIADAMELGVFANVKQQLDFDTMSKIARKYGYTARKAL